MMILVGCKVDTYKVGPSKPVINGVTTPAKEGFFTPVIHLFAAICRDVLPKLSPIYNWFSGGIHLVFVPTENGAFSTEDYAERVLSLQNCLLKCEGLDENQNLGLD